MAGVDLLDSVELIPVLELEPYTFATQSRESPVYRSHDTPEDWSRYWSDSLADSGLIGLQPVRRGSWHVPTTEFADFAVLRRYLGVIFQKWGGIAVLSDPDCRPVLDGGLALRCRPHDQWVEPGCCADLGDAANWREAAAYRQPEWQMLWIGHPWLSVRYQAPWLVLSGEHESDTPTARWAVRPEDLQQAVVAAEVELERFAGQVASALVALGYQGNPDLMGQKLAGLVR